MRPEPEHLSPGFRPAASERGHPAIGRPLGQWLKPAWPAALALAAITFLAFAPALSNGFVKWDDDVNLYHNPSYRGLGWTQVRWMFTTALTGHYIPVVWLSFGIDYTLWGMNPLGYHLTSAVLHAANAALFYLVALRLLSRATGRGGAPVRLGSAAAALFFALHPLRVESVAWATERRDVLSGLFFLLTVLLYLRAAEAPGRSRRWLLAGSLASYGLAILSKSIVMTLPLILLLLDVYPLARLPWRSGAWRTAEARGVFAEKVPYAALALAGGVTSYWTVASSHLLTSTAAYGWPARVAMTGYSLWFYVAKTALPVGLSPLHELPVTVNPAEPRFLLSGLAVLAISALLLAFRRRWPGALAAWIAYGVMLGPVTGIVHSGHQLTHDRYSYLSCLGWALVVGAAMVAVARAAARGTAPRPALARVAAALSVVWVLVLGTLTWDQIQAWRDTETLWRYAVEADPTCSLCQANLGDALYDQNLLALAEQRYEMARALRPDSVRAHIGLGLVSLSRREFDAAMPHFRFAVERRPGDPDVLAAAAFALLKQDRPAEAIPLLERAVRIDPGYFHGQADLGAALARVGETGRAVPHLVRSIELRPDAPTPRANLTAAYLALGQYAAARREYATLVKLDPQVAQGLAPLVLHGAMSARVRPPAATSAILAVR